MHACPALLEREKVAGRVAALQGVLLSVPCQCRGTVSVGWDGRLYDCDFNQQLEMGLRYGLEAFYIPR